MGRVKNFRGAALLVLAMLLSLSLAACGGGGGGGGEQAEEIVVASDIAYPPFEYDEGGEPAGFDIDLMREVGERAGFTPQFQNVTFDGIIGGLQSGNYDAAISAMTITEERQQDVDFSDPYFNADQSLMVRSDSDIRSTDDLAESNVGVQIGTTGADQATALRDEGGVAEVTTFDTVEDAFAALENESVDAVINDFPVSADREQSSGGSLEIVQTIPTGEQYGIAFPKDSELVGRVNEALQEIKDDGTYAEIYERHIGVQPEEIP
ncbi:transporter substrate-binding domain-containing protein [Rubrobacter marinus]|uniref:Transporter substrate-binding domain-containing protein n=1 Tax=Rubrobacter marinus TaxID=2653852 RepID=A0A6G8PSE8_9ACTN|nr:basic amino acid ABC transporter substrate-binding protein [Rubrobacter marinus]QIN77360.1 transporter substrate-binding domain-containing protein [Rubrobacter marinus]